MLGCHDDALKVELSYLVNHLHPIPISYWSGIPSLSWRVLGAQVPPVEDRLYSDHHYYFHPLDWITESLAYFLVAEHATRAHFIYTYLHQAT